MSAEGVQQGEAAHVNTPADLEAAREFIQASEILRRNEHAQKMLENGFVREDGEEVSAREFVKKMEALLTQRKEDPMTLAAEIENALVVHSEPTR